jgi:hypothetical protein
MNKSSGQRAGGQFDHDVGEGQHQPAVGQYPDDDPDDAHGGADLEAVFGAALRAASTNRISFGLYVRTFRAPPQGKADGNDNPIPASRGAA